MKESSLFGGTELEDTAKLEIGVGNKVLVIGFHSLAEQLRQNDAIGIRILRCKLLYQEVRHMIAIFGVTASSPSCVRGGGTVGYTIGA